jgi:hypothetical protein
VVSFVAVTDAVREVLRPAVPGLTLDETVTEPHKVLPSRLYVWPRRLAPHQLEEADGRWDEAIIRLRALVTLPAKGESRVQRGERDLSIALDTLTAALFAQIVMHRRGPLWWDIYVEGVTPDAVRRFDVRGYGLDIAVRLILEPGDGGS